jgi:hypothetical protein
MWQPGIFEMRQGANRQIGRRDPGRSSNGRPSKVAKEKRRGHREERARSYLGESALGEDNQQTGFTAGTIADDDELATNLSHDSDRW